MAKQPKSKAMAYGEVKSPKQFILTDTCSDLIDKLAESAGCSRSEFVERSIRWIDEHWDSQLQRDLSDDES